MADPAAHSPLSKEPLGRWERLTDRVSYGMGRPLNIGIWIVIVAVWFALGFLMPDAFVHGQWLPRWSVSTDWNFPLNTITTLAELYIGFLVGAAANRGERDNRKVLGQIEALAEHVDTTARRNESHILAVKELVLDLHADDLRDDANGRPS